MKIMFVNGQRKEYDLTIPAEKIKEEGFKGEFCEQKHPDDVKKCIEKIKPDLIIASSEVALFITDYDIPMILLQPIVNKYELKKVYPTQNFDFLPDKPSNKADYIEVLIDKKDLILSKKKIKKTFRDKKVTPFSYDEKKLDKLKDVFPLMILEKVRTFKMLKEKKYSFVPTIMRTFTNEELEEILENAIAWDCCEIVLYEDLGIFGYRDRIKMFKYISNYEFKTKEEFLEAVRNIKKENKVCESIILDL